MNDDKPAAPVDASTHLAGSVVAGRYRVDAVVASGANTLVADAYDTVGRRPVTLKVVNPDRLVQASFRDEFERQVAVARSLAHPNIAAVLDSGHVELGRETTLFWVVEYLGGGSLRDLYDRGRLLEPSQALVVGLEACRALGAAHARGVTHTELTPSKMVFGDDARLRIVDLGMAQLLGEEAWAEPATVATHVARYASPEQAVGAPVDAKSDVYALTLCLIEGITGKVPFAGDSTVSTLAARVDKLMPVTADMGSLAAVLERGGRPDPQDRWTADEFAAALGGAAGSLPRPAPIPVLASSLFTPADNPRGDSAAAAVSDGAGVAPSVADVREETPAVGDADVAPRVVTEQMPAAEVDAALMATSPATTQVAVVDGTPTGVLYDDERSTRRWGRILGITAVVLVGLAALGLVLFLLLRTKSYEVPDLVGIDEAVALNEISGNGWDVQTERERSDEVPEVDQVVRTIPAAGEMLDEGEMFVMVVSDGPELRAIPELAGVPLVDAQATLSDLRLGLVEGDPAYSETVPAGSIISWQVQGNASLVAGAQVLPDTVIEVSVSLGPEPRPAPDLTNQTVDEATAALGALQLVIAVGEDEFSSTIEVGRVVVQDPPPGTPVARDGTVTVRVSKGPDLVAIPDLTGQTYPQAQQTLADAGFVIEGLLGTTQGTFVSILVADEEVAAGATFPRGTPVDLIFL